LVKSHRLLLLLGLSAVLILGACSPLSQTPIRRVGRLGTGAAYDVQVQGNYAFVGNNDGVVIIDIHQRNRPRRTATIELGEAAFGIYIENNLAYISGGRDGFTIADVGDPENPRILGTYPSGGAEDVCVQGSVAYVSHAQGELKAIDVQDPANPVLLGSYEGGGMGTGVACHQDLVYFGVAQRGLVVLDLSDPSSPVRVTTVGRTQGAKNMDIAGDLLYLGCHGNGARILDISDPRSPRVLASFSQSGEAWGASGDSTYSWIADLQEGVELYDLRDPGHPRLIARAEKYAPHDITSDGQYAYLADQDKGLVILECVEETIE
jgi:hypothetical protein